MRPILSSSETYNYKLAKWLDEKLKPLSVNNHTISDVFQFTDELREMEISESAILVSYDVSSLFTNVPVDETIDDIAECAFENNWPNTEHSLNIKKSDLVELLRIATKNQLFQWEGNLYEQIDGVAMGSPLGLLMANVFMCKIEKQLENESKMPTFYKRYVDDTLAVMPDVETATEFLSTLNNCHPSIRFTMELEEDKKLPFLGVEISRNGCHLNTKVYRKPTDTGLLLHYQSHVDGRYKRALLNTMINRAYKLSSTRELFHLECGKIKRIFTQLRYPNNLINNSIRRFIKLKLDINQSVQQQSTTKTKDNPIRVILPFKDQKAANSVRRQLKDLSRKIDIEVSPVFTSRKLKEQIKIKENKPPLVSQQCVVYKFECDLCDAGYVGYTCRHLYQRIEEHKNSEIGKHVAGHGADKNISKNFKILKKCKSKLDCLIYEMLFIKEIKPSLNKQCDSIRAKLFT